MSEIEFGNCTQYVSILAKRLNTLIGKCYIILTGCQHAVYPMCFYLCVNGLTGIKANHCYKM